MSIGQGWPCGLAESRRHGGQPGNCIPGGCSRHAVQRRDSLRTGGHVTHSV